MEARIQALEARISEIEAEMPEDKVTLIVFSGELDRVLASFIIATGALAVGYEVSMFFTFWGLNAVREKRIMSGKNISERMMAMMVPDNTQAMGVSKMNFFGIGAKMLRHMMKEKNVESIEDLIDLTVDMGATMYSCAMSRDVMGIDHQELRDGTIEAGAVAMLADSFKSKATLFI
jgi:peroxiredoxin family protein